MNVCITEERKVRYMARRNDEIENYTSVDDQLRNEVNKPAPYCYYTLCPSYCRTVYLAFERQQEHQQLPVARMIRESRYRSPYNIEQNRQAAGEPPHSPLSHTLKPAFPPRKIEIRE